MGEQYLTFTITSETPIDWAVGDFCEFRGETFTLNYVPSVTQKAGTNERQDAYTYENVKFDSFQEELTRCLMLDITATNGEYIAAQGTNYTGSSKFTLFCGETYANGATLTPVCVLVAKMQANLDRMYGVNGWKIFVDTTSTYINAAGDAVLVTHTEDKALKFDNTTVAQALAEVHNTFDLDYCIRGRNIYIGYNLKNLTSDNDNETFAFGYGKGYPTHESQNKALFQIKRIANPQQKIVTRLRAFGSTKNMPYRYYNRIYHLSQSLFPTNLQLPDTFAELSTKNSHNALRDAQYGINPVTNLPYLRHVKGSTNDSYIDKGDSALQCPEGIREHSARWDGSDSNLPEIYPTIEEATYGELRGALVEDQDGRSGSGSFPNYSDSERIDKLLAIGYSSEGSLVDDANKGDGILPESGISSTGVPRNASIGATYHTYSPTRNGDFTYRGNGYEGKEKTLFTIQGVAPGKFAMAPTIGAVIYGFSLSCYRDGCSCDVGYKIQVKAKNVETGVTTTIASYTSDFVSLNRSDGVKEMELPELPDVKEQTPKVSQILVANLSDITVTFTPIIRNVTVPSGFTDSFSFNYQVGNSRLSHDVTAEPEYTWFPIDDSGNLIDRFHVFVQDMGFDIQACWTDETPVMAMKSGRCVGREFEILSDVQKVTYGNKQGYMLTLKRATDDSLHTYYPSQTDPIQAGDNFVLLGISMPDAYVKMAEIRLLRAATDYLADNCETKFTYQPYIDDLYLQRNLDAMTKANTPNKSIFWRLYAGLKFTFRGVPSSENEPAPLADITIEKVTISMGESLTPKVELTLNDDVQQSTIQKLTTNVDRIYNGSIFNGGNVSGSSTAVGAAILSILESEGDKLFLSKKHDDVAEGKITFNDVVTLKETLKAQKGIKIGNYQSRFLGSGALIDEEGNAEFESIYSRNFISTPEFRFNRINVTEGEDWCTNGFGTIKEVEIIDETTGTITLKLEENDYASIKVGDICRGIYNDIAHQYETKTLEDDSELYDEEVEEETEVSDVDKSFGFSAKEGFFTSYFWVRQMITNEKGECKFIYELRNSKTPHPCEFMRFAQYGSFTDSDRRSSSYSTSIGHYYEMVLDGVNTWKIKSANVVYRKGYLGNMTVQLKNGKEAELQGYGLYVQDNVYFGNAVVQIDPETLADLEDKLKTYEVEFSDHVDVVTVDDVGNCIGGIYSVSGGYRSYRINSAITVRKNHQLLRIAADTDDAAEGTYKIYAQPRGCTCVIENSTIYITSIDNIKDGVAGSEDDVNFDYDAMREMDSCYVDLIIDCEGNGSIQKRFPIRILHSATPYVDATINNQFSAVSWNTKIQQYIGLPIPIKVKLWHNNEQLKADSVAINGVTGATLAETSKTITVDGMSIETALTRDSSGDYININIVSLPSNLALVSVLNITATTEYAGVPYERTITHTINKNTDVNVYSLAPSVTDIVYNPNSPSGNGLSVDFLSCSVFCDSSDNKHYEVDPATYAVHGIIIYYQLFYKDGTAGEPTYYDASLDGIPVATNLQEVKFYLYGVRNGGADTSVVHDSQNVPIIAAGVDGESVEYVFFRQNFLTPYPTLYDDPNERQRDDYLPYTDENQTARWTDDAVGIDEDHKYEFYAIRRKINGVWQAFGDIMIFNQYHAAQYSVDLTSYVDVITVDDAGNVIGGLYTLSGANNEYKNYRIHSAITVRLGQDLLTEAASGADAGDGTFKIYAQPRGCSCVVENSTIFITGINNIKDGVAGTQDDTNFDYDAMREMSECSVDLVIDCEGRKSITKRLPITIKHDSQPFISADISNEFSGVSWNTQTQAYIGLPITFDFTMWHNDEFLNIENANNVSLSTSTSGVTLVNGAAPATLGASSIYYTKTIETIVKNQGTVNQYSYKVARITITAMGADVPLVTDISVTASAIYSGVTYERTLVHTINKSTDTNVYSLLPSASEIVLDKNTNSLNISTLTCSVICDSSDDKHYTVAYADFATHGIIMYYKKFYTNGTSDADETLYENTAISVDATVAEVRFYLYGRNGNNPDRTIVHDQEGVSIISSGENGDDAANYYLTSDINTIVKDKNDAFKGSARPTITAWKKVGDNEAVRLADIVDGNGVVAEGMTINAYEMNGNTVEYTNTSTTGVLTVATPYSYVDRFEVELVKNSKTYATMSIPILKEVQGDQGEAGVYPRDRGIFATGETYYYTKQGGVYIRDMVRYEIGGIMYGFLVKTKGATVTAAPKTKTENGTISWDSTDTNWEMSGIVKTVIANTIFGTNANLGGFMASAQRFLSTQIAYFIRYKGAYSASSGYTYMVENSSDNGAPTLEMVAYGDYYWVPKGEGSITGQTPSTSSAYWRKATSEEARCVESGIDSNGNLTLVKTPLYKLELNGIDGIIKLLHEEGYKWEVTKDGIQLLGVDSGRHIEIDPNKREIRIYNDSGVESVRFDGETINGLNYLFSGATPPTVTITNSSGSKSYTGNASGGTAEVHTEEYIGSFTTTGSGRLNLSVTLKARANRQLTVAPGSGGNSSEQELQREDDIPYSDTHGNWWLDNVASIQIIIKTVRSGGTSAGVSIASYALTASGESSWKTTAQVRDVFLMAGTHTIYARCYFILREGTSNYGNVQWSGLTANFVYDFYQSRVFANGLVFGSSEENFVAIIRESGGNMSFKAITDAGAVGMQMYGGQLSTIYRKKLLRQTIVLGYGRCHCYTLNDNATGSVQYSSNAHRTGDSYSLSREGQGKWKLTFPSSWADLSLQANYLFVTVTPVDANGYVRMACVSTITSTYCIIYTGDDDSPNDDIDFHFKIEYMLP